MARRGWLNPLRRAFDRERRAVRVDHKGTALTRDQVRRQARSRVGQVLDGVAARNVDGVPVQYRYRRATARPSGVVKAERRRRNRAARASRKANR